MQVTSIRLEPELKDRLRQISGDRGYQALIREVLWQYVEQANAPELERSLIYPPSFSSNQIRAIFAAIAQQREYCALTGQIIQPQQAMWLGLTTTGELIPLSQESQFEDNRSYWESDRG
jgi:hypothetical protein